MNKTENLNLNKYDPILDAKEPFSISDGLNANWDIIDENFKNLKNTDEQLKTKIETLPTISEIHLAMMPDFENGLQPRSVNITYTASTWGWIRWEGHTGHAAMYLQVNGKIIQITEALGANDTCASACLILVKPNDIYYCNGGTIEFYTCSGI